MREGWHRARATTPDLRDFYPTAPRRLPRMAEIVFAGGEVLAVTEELIEVLDRLGRATAREPATTQTDRGPVDTTGLATFHAQRSSKPVYVMPGAVAYVRDAPEYGSAQF
jgi:hypothetical protein